MAPERGSGQLLTAAHQTDIFSPIAGQPDFAELCTVLYERELHQLASWEPTAAGAAQLKGLQARLRSMPHYVRKAARGMLQSESPLALDIQNGSWYAKQVAQFAPTSTQQQKLEKLIPKVKLGLVLPVWVSRPGLTQVRLDSIDRVDGLNQPSQARVRLNEFGWFNAKGEALEAQPASVRVQLLAPDKKSLTAACCGHQWNHKGRMDPRTLSLREILLAATLCWAQPLQVVRIPS